MFAVYYKQVCVAQPPILQRAPNGSRRAIWRPRLGMELASELVTVVGRPFPKLVIQTHGLTPIGHGVGWVFLFDFLKPFAGLFVFKRMQKSYAALKLRMRGLNAGSGERHRASRRHRGGGVPGFERSKAKQGEARRRECKD